MPSLRDAVSLLLVGASLTCADVFSGRLDQESMFAERQLSNSPLPPLSNLKETLGLADAANVVSNETAIKIAGFDYYSVTQRGAEMSSHSWEWGTAAQALLEVYNPELSVFGPGWSSFPPNVANRVPVVQPDEVVSLAYARKHISPVGPALVKGAGSAGDPASLGVAAIMLAQTNAWYGNASEAQAYHLLAQVPKYSNGAISHREAEAELWADNMYMMPPFLAYFAVASNSSERLPELVRQIDLQRQVLALKLNSSHPGLWRHIVGPSSQTLGIWSTGNAWAAMGMSRVLATIYNSQETPLTTVPMQVAAGALTRWMTRMFDALLAARDNLDPANRLVKNYIVGGSHGANSSATFNWWGEAAGTAGLASAIYRLAVLDHQHAGKNTVNSGSMQQYILWADQARKAVVQHTINTNDWIIAPTVNPYDWLTQTPYMSGSPEANCFVGMMGAAYVDCVNAGVCKQW